MIRPHRLDPLLRPRGVAIVGGSDRAGSVGAMAVRQIVHGGFEGPVTVVNPRAGTTVQGLPAVPTIAEVPGGAEHVVFVIGDERIEAEFAAAIRAGARAATIMSPLALPDDRDPPLKERIRAMAREAGVVLCGGNGMGFYHFHQKLWVCGFRTRPDHRAGGTVLLTHSGSLFTALVDSEARIDYGLAVSSGQELNTTLADYMDFALDQPWTRVIGLFMETARDPAGFEAALAKAAARNIPVVALKVGRTEASARLAVSHSGAIAGDHAAYAALFARYGVGEVRSVDELAAALMLLPETAALGPGGLAASHDSGGERGVMIDLSADHGVPFAELSPPTVERLRAALDFGLEPVNPLDRWGTGRNYPADFFDSFRALMDDPGVAVGAVVLDRGVGGEVNPLAIEIARETRAATGKPVVIVSNHQGSGSDPAAIETTRAGVPVLDALPPFLRACRIAFDRRDARARPASTPPAPDPAAVALWRARLAAGGSFDEADGLALLADFGVPVAAHAVAETAGAAVAAARSIGFPVVLKTAAPGILHKSDVDGVRLGLADAAAVEAAYRDIAARLGPRVLVAAMAGGPAVEMILGLVGDPDLGPVVLVGTGGIHAEILKDAVTARPPFDAAEARRMIDRLRLRPLLDGARGAPAADLDALSDAVSRFSVLAAALGDRIATMDVNPLRAGPGGALAVDALVVARVAAEETAR
jgi:acyl-CoA synthetase (NDP forming)